MSTDSMMPVGGKMDLATEKSDLVKRLRVNADYGYGIDERTRGAMRNAADAIADLVAENERLHLAYVAAKKGIARLLVENEELRAALPTPSPNVYKPRRP